VPPHFLRPIAAPAYAKE